MRLEATAEVAAAAAAAAAALATTLALAMAMSMSMAPVSGRNNATAAQVHFSCTALEAGSCALELQSLTSVIARQKDKTVACPALRQNRQTGRQADGATDGQTDRLAGLSQGRQRYLHAIKFPGLLLCTATLAEFIFNPR